MVGWARTWPAAPNCPTTLKAAALALIHEFGQSDIDWNHLAAGTIAGHIIECGVQFMGSNFSRL